MNLKIKKSKSEKILRFKVSCSMNYHKFSLINSIFKLEDEIKDKYEEKELE